MAFRIAYNGTVGLILTALAIFVETGCLDGKATATNLL
jgi:hypothetical protein